MKKKSIVVKAGIIILVQKALTGLKGDRPVMLSRRIGMVREELQALQNPLTERAAPYITSDGAAKKDLEEEEVERFEEILNEDLTMEIPVITLSELSDAGITVEDDSILSFLIELGIVEDDVSDS